MYSPYLYARASELLALRSLISEKTDLTGLLPIIEPVISDTSGIHRCMDAFGNDKKPLIVVTNPNQHQYLNSPATRANFVKSSQNLFNSHTTLLPGYCIGSTTTQKDVGAFLTQYPGKNVVLLYNNPALSEVEIQTNVTFSQVLFHVVLNDKISTAQLSKIPKKQNNSYSRLFQ